MRDRLRTLADARVLLTNDDGIDGAGLAVLEAVMATLAREVWVVAPETEQSGCGHSLTLHRPLRVRALGERRFAVDGTPSDCVALAVNHLMSGCRPDLVISGINRGANLGEDATYSGTVAAAMEATLQGIPALAFSLQMHDRRQEPRWPTATAWLPTLLPRVLGIPLPRHCLLSINFPDCPPEQVAGIKPVRHGIRKVGDAIEIRDDPRGRRYYWIGLSQDVDGPPPEDTDLAAVEAGWITVTPITLDLTDMAALAVLTEGLT